MNRLRIWQINSISFATLLVLSVTANAQPPKRPKGTPPFVQPPGIPQIELPKLMKVKPVKVLPTDTKLQRLMKERYNAAVEVIKHHGALVQIGRAVFDEPMIDDARDLVTAGLAIKSSAKQKSALLRSYVDLLKDIEQVAKSKARIGGAGTRDSDVARIRYLRLDAEIKLHQQQMRANQVAPGRRAGGGANIQIPPSKPPPFGQPPRNPQKKYKLPELMKVKPVRVLATDTKLQRLQKERYNAAVEIIQQHALFERLGAHNPHAPRFDSVILVARDLVTAGLAIKSSAKQKAALLQNYVDFVKGVEQRVEALAQVGGRGATRVHIARIRYLRLDAEIQLLQQKQRQQ